MFKPGESGNPSGRPKDVVGQMIRANKGLPKKIISGMVKLSKSKDENISLKAFEKLKEWGWPTPRAVAIPDGEGEGGRLIFVL